MFTKVKNFSFFLKPAFVFVFEFNYLYFTSLLYFGLGKVLVQVVAMARVFLVSPQVDNNEDEDDDDYDDNG